MNKLPNKNILWWAPAYTSIKTVKNVFLTIDTVLGYDSLTKDWSYNKTNNKIGIPQGAEDYTIICNNANPYIRVYRAWRQDCIKRYKILPTLEQWAVNLTTIRSGKFSSTFDLNEPVSAEIIKTGKTPTFYIRTESLAADIAATNLFDMNSKQIKNILSDVEEGEKSAIANLLLDDKITNTNNIDLFANWKTHYNQSLADSVYTMLKVDFDYFGYDKDSWKV